MSEPSALARRIHESHRDLVPHCPLCDERLFAARRLPEWLKRGTAKALDWAPR